MKPNPGFLPLLNQEITHVLTYFPENEGRPESSLQIARKTGWLIHTHFMRLDQPDGGNSNPHPEKSSKWDKSLRGIFFPKPLAFLFGSHRCYLLGTRLSPSH